MALPAANATVVATTTVALVKGIKNTMDQGSLRFNCTFAKEKGLTTWGATGRAYVEFPSYYRPNLGYAVTCSLEDKDKKHVENLYCYVRWDYSLVIFGPTGKAVT